MAEVAARRLGGLLIHRYDKRNVLAFHIRYELRVQPSFCATTSGIRKNKGWVRLLPMQPTLQDLLNMLSRGWKITSTSFHFTQAQGETVTVNLERQGKSMELISSDDKFTDYVACLKPLPTLGGSMEFVRVDDVDGFYEIEEMAVDLLTDRSPAFCCKQNDLGKARWTPLKTAVEDFVRTVAVAGPPAEFTAFRQVLLVHYGTEIDVEILDKDKIDLTGLDKLRGSSCVACSFLGFAPSPKSPSKDIIVGLVIYDVAGSEVLACNIDTLTTWWRRLGIPPDGDYHRVLAGIVDRTFADSGNLRSWVPIPAESPTFTCIPWIVFVCFNPPNPAQLQDHLTLTIPEFLVFGDPGAPSKAVYSLGQTQDDLVFRIGLRFQKDSEVLLYQLRFDRSRGEPNLHVDMQIYAKACYTDKLRVLSHVEISATKVLEFSKPLFISFLSAAVFDPESDASCLLPISRWE